MADDFLICRARLWAPNKGRLIEVARKGVGRDAMRAAYARGRALDACLRAMDAQEDCACGGDCGARI